MRDAMPLRRRSTTSVFFALDFWERQALEAGINYIRELGVEIQSLAQDVKWHEDRCTHCTACISICPPRALDVDRKTMEVSFNRDKCIVCEACIPSGLRIALSLAASLFSGSYIHR
jgi:ferredoxin